MGLDQYLRKKVYLRSWPDTMGEKSKSEIVKDALSTIGMVEGRPTHIVYDAGSWRKANQIHNWFVQNVQKGNDDCGEYYVEIDQLKDLLSICEQIKSKVIMEETLIKNGMHSEKQADGTMKLVPNMIKGMKITNPEVCEELLPSAEGFFFGSTDYDQWYMDDIDRTIDILSKICNKEDDTYTSYYYSSSW